MPRDAPHRTYRDGWPKPEVLCALRETEALCGFRDPDETYALFGRLGVPRVMALLAPLAEESVPAMERLGVVFGRLLRLRRRTAPLVDAVLAAARVVTDNDADVQAFARTATEIGSFYPGDPGVLAALLMNRITLQPNEALYLPAGNLHAYLSGGGVEIMANSDNVMRGGLTPKHIDVTELLRVVDFTPGFGGLIEPRQEAPGVWHYPVPAPEFALWRIELGEDAVPVPAAGSGRILLVTDGSVTLQSGEDELELARGGVGPADRHGARYGDRPGHGVRRRPRRVLNWVGWRGTAGVAQSVAHLPCKRVVGGSSPPPALRVRPTPPGLRVEPSAHPGCCPRSRSLDGGGSDEPAPCAPRVSRNIAGPAAAAAARSAAGWPSSG